MTDLPDFQKVVGGLAISTPSEGQSYIAYSMYGTVDPGVILSIPLPVVQSGKKRFFIGLVASWDTEDFVQETYIERQSDWFVFFYLYHSSYALVRLYYLPGCEAGDREYINFANNDTANAHTVYAVVYYFDQDV